MLPFAYEWHWDPGHIIFFGLFYLALTVIGLGVTVAVLLTFWNVYSKEPMHHEEHDGEDPWAGYTYVHDKAARGEYA